ncbi:MAG: DUF1318 domain-containing protein [Candidatus Omnitrophota bacterium]
MLKEKTLLLLLPAILIIFSSCRIETVGDPNRPIKIEAHITIDIRQVKDTVSSIEDMVSGKNTPAPSVQPDKNSFLLLEYAYAQALPAEVQNAIEARRARYQTVKDYKKQGFVGENNRGYVTSFSEDITIGVAVEQENKDRLVIYKNIVEQKGYPKEALGQIENVSAQEQRDRAEAGEKIQLENGEWTTK